MTSVELYNSEKNLHKQEKLNHLFLRTTDGTIFKNKMELFLKTTDGTKIDITPS